jgi:hypothetical protein
MFIYSLLLYEFITDTFDGFNMFVSDLTADLPDVHIHGPFAYMGIIAPDVIKYLIPAEQAVGFGCHQGKNFEFLSGQLDLLLILYD